MPFPQEIRRQIRREQHNLCASCGMESEKIECHHIQPKSHGGQDIRENGVGLCKEACHPLYDHLALEKGIYYTEVQMQGGVEYAVGLANSVINADELRIAEIRKELHELVAAD